MLDLKKIDSLLRSIIESNSGNASIPSVKNLPKKELVKAAQKEYDAWDPSGEDGDPELGFGGICQDVAEAMAGVLSTTGIDAATVSAQIGDQLVWVVAYFG